MATVSTEDPQFQRAIQACAVALRRMADYESGQAIALFNPRIQAWAEHFQWSEQHPFEIEGITAHGRAIVVRLQMNHPDLVSIRRLLAELGLPWKTEASKER